MRTLSSLLFVLSALICASCSSSSGNGPPQTIAAEPAPTVTTPSSAPTEGTMQIELYVPAAEETPSAATDVTNRKRMFVSPNVQSLVAHITEPNVLPSPLQDRTEAHNVSPGFNSITLYAPPGTVTIVLRLYSLANGKGVELGRSDPNSSALQDIVLDGIHPVSPLVTIDPIVTSVQLQITSATRPVGCKGATGDAVAIGLDPSNAKVLGPGKFLDANEHYVTYSIGPASPPSRPSTIAAQSVFTAPLSIGGTIASGTNAVSFVEGNPAYDENSPATAGTYVWYIALHSSTIAGQGAATPFDSLQCLPGIFG